MPTSTSSTLSISNIQSTGGDYYSTQYPNITVSSSTYFPIVNFLCNVKVESEFSDYKFLSYKLIKISNNKMVFYNLKEKNGRIEPYESLKKIIKEGKKFDIVLKLDFDFDIKFKAVKLKKIIEKFKIDNCEIDISKVKVKFKCEDIIYINRGLSLEEERKDKLEKIISN